MNYNFLNRWSLSFLFVLREKRTSIIFWILWLYTNRERLFFRYRGLKCVYVLEYLWLTSDKALSCDFGKSKTFSVHVTRFKYKIYRWRCFCHLWDLYVGMEQERVQDYFCSVVFKLRCHLGLFLFAKINFNSGVTFSLKVTKVQWSIGLGIFYD